MLSTRVRGFACLSERVQGNHIVVVVLDNLPRLALAAVMGMYG